MRSDCPEPVGTVPEATGAPPAAGGRLRHLRGPGQRPGAAGPGGPVPDRGRSVVPPRRRIDHGEDPVSGTPAGVRAEETGLQVEVGALRGVLSRREHAAQRDPPPHRQDRLRHRLLSGRAPTRPAGRRTPPAGSISTGCRSYRWPPYVERDLAELRSTGPGHARPAPVRTNGPPRPAPHPEPAAGNAGSPGFGPGRGVGRLLASGRRAGFPPLRNSV